MSLKEQIESGKVFTEYGHTAQEDREYEKIIEAQRRKSKQLCFRYNQTDPMDEEGREKLVRELLGGTGKTLWLEAPIHFAYGCHTTVGDHFYSNFNLTVVDDGRVSIGNGVMFGPNVTISTTGHPVHPYYRMRGAHFSLPVVIEDGVWIGANVVVMPGVTIGKNSVIGAGSVVRHSGERRRLRHAVPRDSPDYGCGFGNHPTGHDDQRGLERIKSAAKPGCKSRRKGVS